METWKKDEKAIFKSYYTNKKKLFKLSVFYPCNVDTAIAFESYDGYRTQHDVYILNMALGIRKTSI